MAQTPVVQVSHLLDERGISGFQIQLIVWSVLIALFDGYDIAAIALAAPHLVADWHVQRSALGPVLAASNIGVLFGSMIFGWIGDRYGRKNALIQSLLLFGILTWLAAHATNLQQMFWLRLIAGLGIGGVIPNLIAICAFFWMPESIKYMSIHEGHRAKLTRLLERLSPGYRVPEGARFVVEDERQAPGTNPKYLFGEGLAVITPLLWLLFALNLMGFFFVLLWTPTLLTAAKLPPATAALAVASLQVGGTVGTLALIPWIRRRQFLGVAILFLIAVPVVGSIGFIGLNASQAVLLVVTFIAGACVLGVQSGINVCGALVYPTSLRALGSGWELGIGRLGSIVGPLVGALFVTLPVDKLYMWSATPFLIGALICFTVHRLNQARIRERPYLAEGTPAPVRSAATRRPAS